MMLNKIAGAFLAALLFVFFLTELGNVMTGEEEVARAFVIEVPEQAAGPAEPVEEEVLDLGALLREASVEAGQNAARACVACHSFEKGGPNKVGPNLWDIVMADKAHLANFSYSNALSDMEGSWTYEALNAFLENPSGYVRGTSMSYAGINRTNQRMNVIAYLRSLSDDPKPLPDPLPQEEEQAALDN